MQGATSTIFRRYAGGLALIRGSAERHDTRANVGRRRRCHPNPCGALPRGPIDEKSWTKGGRSLLGSAEVPWGNRRYLGSRREHSFFSEHKHSSVFRWSSRRAALVSLSLCEGLEYRLHNGKSKPGCRAAATLTIFRNGRSREIGWRLGLATVRTGSRVKRIPGDRRKEYSHVERPDCSPRWGG